MAKLKVCHILWNVRVGGTEMIVIDIMNEQARRGLDVTLMVMGRRGDESMISRIDPSIRIMWLNRPDDSRNQLKRNIKPLAQLNLLLLGGNYDIVHMHEIVTPRAVRVLGRKHKLLTLHYALSKREPLNSIDHIVGISQSTCRYINHHYGKQAICNYNGIPFDNAPIKTSYEPSTPFRIVQVGRVHLMVKGQDIALKAIAKLVNEGHTDISLDFIGDGIDMEQLRDMVEQLHLQPYVKTLGTVDRDDIMRMLPTYDLLIQPSLSEQFGLTVAEAMGCGVPVLVSDIEGPAEIVENGHWGKMFKSGDADQLANQILYTKNNYDSVAETAREATAHVRDVFSIKANVDRYAQIYRDMLSNKKPQHQ